MAVRRSNRGNTSARANPASFNRELDANSALYDAQSVQEPPIMSCSMPCLCGCNRGVVKKMWLKRMLRLIARRIRIHHLLPMLGPSWCLAMPMGVKKNGSAVCGSLNILYIFLVLYLCHYARSFLSSASFPNQVIRYRYSRTARTTKSHDEGHSQRYCAGAHVPHIRSNHPSPEWQPPNSHIRRQRVLDIEWRAVLHSWCSIPARWSCRCAGSYA